eukprot:244844-Rhodomonas_salina.3
MTASGSCARDWECQGRRGSRGCGISLSRLGEFVLGGEGSAVASGSQAEKWKPSPGSLSDKA